MRLVSTLGFLLCFSVLNSIQAQARDYEEIQNYTATRRPKNWKYETPDEAYNRFNLGLGVIALNLDTNSPGAAKTFSIPITLMPLISLSGDWVLSQSIALSPWAGITPFSALGQFGLNLRLMPVLFRAKLFLGDGFDFRVGPGLMYYFADRNDASRYVNPKNFGIPKDSGTATEPALNLGFGKSIENLTTDLEFVIAGTKGSDRFYHFIVNVSFNLLP